jgi:hypothetical protein
VKGVKGVENLLNNFSPPDTKRNAIGGGSYALDYYMIVC